MDGVQCPGCPQMFSSRYNMKRHCNQFHHSGNIQSNVKRRRGAGVGAPIGIGAPIGAPIGAGAHVGAGAPIEAGAHVGAGAPLGAPIGAGAHVEAGAPIESGAQVGAGALIEAGAHVGAGAIIEAEGVGGVNFQFKHPFTMVVSGPTSCGKTHFVKTMLQTNDTVISPPPERIIWLYKRWQPMYDVIGKTVYPPVEFVKGIPFNLEQDGYLNTSKNNLIVLDDLMSTAGKDPRISELFTEGSHHRNLSVIALNQNLYHSKDPTQRRNCHYLTLFNSPIDRQQIMTLARQMYPNNPQHFMGHFQEAISRPYGHLVVDLKPTTPESMRLRNDVLQPQNVIRGDRAQEVIRGVPEQEIVRREFTPLKTEEETEICQEMPSCDDCGLLFESTHDLQRHVKRWCPERDHESLKRYREDDDEEGSANRLKWPTISKNEDEMSEEHNDEEGEHRAYDRLFDLAKDHNEDERKMKIKQYVERGMPKKDAETKADIKLRDLNLKCFLKKYGVVLKYIMDLRHGPLHNQVMRSIDRYMDGDNDIGRSIRIALKKHKHELEIHVDDEEDEEEEEEDEEDEEEEDEDKEDDED